MLECQILFIFQSMRLEIKYIFIFTKCQHKTLLNINLLQLPSLDVFLNILLALIWRKYVFNVAERIMHYVGLHIQSIRN